MKLAYLTILLLLLLQIVVASATVNQLEKNITKLELSDVNLNYVTVLSAKQVDQNIEISYSCSLDSIESGTAYIDFNLFDNKGVMVLPSTITKNCAKNIQSFQIKPDLKDSTYIQYKITSNLQEQCSICEKDVFLSVTRQQETNIPDSNPLIALLISIIALAFVYQKQRI